MIEQVLQTLRSPRFYLALSLSTITAALVAVPLGIQAVQVREAQVLSLGTPQDSASTTLQTPIPSTPATNAIGASESAPDSSAPTSEATPKTTEAPNDSEAPNDPATSTQDAEPEVPADDTEIAAPAVPIDSTTASSVMLPEPVESSDVSIVTPTTPLAVKPGPPARESTTVTTGAAGVGDGEDDGSEPSDTGLDNDTAPANPDAPELDPFDPTTFDPSVTASTPTTVADTPANPTTLTTVDASDTTVADPAVSVPAKTTTTTGPQPSTTDQPTMGTGGSTTVQPSATTPSQTVPSDPIDSRVQFPVQAN